MNILYIFAHPNQVSFNAMLKDKALEILSKSKCHIKISDLYETNFKAIADWDDFQQVASEMNSQYFLAQQQALNNHLLKNDITSELDKISWADHIIFQFPLWWFSTPAILKGWLDRVLVKGYAYDTGKTFSDGLLKGKTASLIVTTQSPESAYQTEGLHQATIDSFLHHIHHTLRFVGMHTLDPFVIYSAFNLSPIQKKLIMDKLNNHLDNIINPDNTN